MLGCDRDALLLPLQPPADCVVLGCRDSVELQRQSIRSQATRLLYDEIEA
jgi:hypothetical protein